MRQFKFPFNKVASAMSTNKSFVELVASEGIPTFVSTGMSEIKDIDWVVNTFKKYDCELMLMHTVSTYPSLEEDLNLNVFKLLKINTIYQLVTVVMKWVYLLRLLLLLWGLQL